jgi:dephospho-CoA kinase
MLRVGLTGGIATGKSTLAKTFEKLGAWVIDADAIAHELQRPHTPIWKEIVGVFGEKILRVDRSIDRSTLGRIVFSDHEKRARLERIMHPAIIAQEEERMSEWERSGKIQIAMVEEALLVETGSFRRFHKVVLVVASEETQIERLRQRGLTEKEALSRIRSQMPLSEKVPFADYLIENSGEISEAERKAGEVYRDLLEQANLLNAKKAERSSP